MKRYQKIVVGVLISAIVLIGSIQIYISFFLDEQLKETAVERFHEATDDAYELEIKDFDLQILGRQLSLSGIQLSKKEASSGSDIQLTLDEFNVSGIGVIKLLLQHELSLNNIEIINPDIYVTAPKKESSTQKTPWHRPSQQLSKMVLKVVDQISVPNLNITGLSLYYNRANLPVAPLLSLSNSDIKLHNITIDSTSLKDERVIPADDITIAFRNVQFQTPNELYKITTGDVDFSTTDSQLVLREFSLIPQFDKQAFSDNVGHQIDRLNMDIKEIKWDGIDIEMLNKAESITTRLINITNADINIYRDKRPPESPKKYKPLPQEMIRDIPFPTTIDSIHISNSNIRYTERKPNTEKAGYIEFAHLSADFTDLTNVEAHWDNGRTPTLHATTNVMNKGQLEAQFTFMMTSDNRQEIKGSLQSMDMQPLNDALEPIAFVRIEEGNILGLDFEMNLSAKNAGGSLTLEYENLKISLLDEGLSEESFGNKAKSFVANTFKLKSDNKNDDLRSAKVDFERVEHKSVFNYWWKSLLSGLKSSIGL
ncbi:hypothetical protein [Fodinibius sp. Rm-B-1B1-1]|uniref:hypothetical protein n=1 Tax=Fodinibius alkaliphilus TaxID=3140241 RepID=UPI00315AE488